MRPARGEESSPLKHTRASVLLNKACPQEKRFYQSLTCWVLSELNPTGEGKYPTLALSSHPVSPTEGKLRSTMKVTAQEHQKADTIDSRTRTSQHISRDSVYQQGNTTRELHVSDLIYEVSKRPFLMTLPKTTTPFSLAARFLLSFFIALSTS